MGTMTTDFFLESRAKWEKEIDNISCKNDKTFVTSFILPFFSFQVIKNAFLKSIFFYFILLFIYQLLCLQLTAVLRGFFSFVSFISNDGAFQCFLKHMIHKKLKISVHWKNIAAKQINNRGFIFLHPFRQFFKPDFYSVQNKSTVKVHKLKFEQWKSSWWNVLTKISKIRTELLSTRSIGLLLTFFLERTFSAQLEQNSFQNCFRSIRNIIPLIY